MPRAYSARILSSKPVNRRSCLAKARIEVRLRRRGRGAALFSGNDAAKSRKHSSIGLVGLSTTYLEGAHGESPPAPARSPPGPAPSHPTYDFAEPGRAIIAAVIAVHRELGPGLLESAYQACLEYELLQRKVNFERQVMVPLNYRVIRIDCGYRLDFLVDERVVVEAKSVERLMPIHIAQLITYLKLTKSPVGLLLNFNVTSMRRAESVGLRTVHSSPTSLTSMWNRCRRQISTNLLANRSTAPRSPGESGSLISPTSL